MGTLYEYYKYIFEWKTKNENYIQLQQIHISKMKDLPDRRKKAELLQEKRKKKTKYKIDSDMFWCGF